MFGVGFPNLNWIAPQVMVFKLILTIINRWNVCTILTDAIDIIVLY